MLGFEKPVKMVWQLEWARFLAPAATLIGAALLLFDQFRLGIRLRWIGLWGGHRVVCGLGRKGSEIARATQEGTEEMVAVSGVVVIERDPDHPLIEMIRAQGIPVIVGDASIPSVLSRAGIKKAREIVITCGLDDENAQVAVTAMDCLAESSLEHEVQLVPHLSLIHISEPTRPY